MLQDGARFGSGFTGIAAEYTALGLDQRQQ
jgi:hypothetical protein